MKKDLNFTVGLTSTQIKDLKKQALNESLIYEQKREYFLTESGEKYLLQNPVISWCNDEYPKRPEVNLEYLKLDKAPPTLTRAIRLLAKHLLENEELKENSTEHFLVRELLCSCSACKEVQKGIENYLLIYNPNNNLSLASLYQKFMDKPYGLTKSIISLLLLDVLVRNKDILAIYENRQFQLKLDPLMFDRMIYVPQNFEIKKTIMEELPIIEELSKVILPCKSKNILDLTKGLIYFIRNLDKYTLNTERLSKSTIRLRNTILNAKDPISLFYRDIPKILCNKILCQCDKELAESFDNAIKELQDCYAKLIEELNEFLFNSFNATERKNLAERFEIIQEYICEDELKILYNNIKDLNSSDALWIERIATFINKSRVPKDWSNNDVAYFKVKVKDLSLKFKTIEATAGDSSPITTDLQMLINQIKELNELQRKTVLKEVING